VKFYCANTTALHMRDWNLRKGSLGRTGLQNGSLHEKG